MLRSLAEYCMMMTSNVSSWSVSDAVVSDGASATLAALIVVPGWDLSLLTSASASVVSGGITNAIWCIGISPPLPPGAPSHALVRVFGAGSSVFIDREADTARVAALASRGLGPLLYGAFANGRVEQWFADTRPLEPAEMSAPHHASAIARATAALHVGAADLLITSEAGDFFPPPVLWRRVTSWLDVASAAATTTTTRSLAVRYAREAAAWAETALGAAAAARWSDKARARAEAAAESPALATARAAGAAAGLCVVFAHNDLLSGNILVPTTSGTSPSDVAVRLIDTEYAAPNYLGFEIANHWFEICGFEVDLSRFPSVEARADWTRAYVDAGGAGSAGAAALAAGPAAAAAFADELASTATRFVVASHLWWGSWALVQAGLTTSSCDFDYGAYAERRLALIDKHAKEFFE